VMVLKPLILKRHARMFGVFEAQISVAAYAYLGLFKVLIIMLNIVPYIALLILSK